MECSDTAKRTSPTNITASKSLNLIEDKLRTSCTLSSRSIIIISLVEWTYTLFLSESTKLRVKVVNKDVVLFKAIDEGSNYSESGIIDRKTGELVHEISKNIKSENSEKDIAFYSCSKKENVWFFFIQLCVRY